LTHGVDTLMEERQLLRKIQKQKVNYYGYDKIILYGEGLEIIQ